MTTVDLSKTYCLFQRFLAPNGAKQLKCLRHGSLDYCHDLKDELKDWENTEVQAILTLSPSQLGAFLQAHYYPMLMSGMSPDLARIIEPICDRYAHYHHPSGNLRISAVELHTSKQVVSVLYQLRKGVLKRIVGYVNRA